MLNFYYNCYAIYCSVRKGFLLQDLMSLWSQIYFFLKLKVEWYLKKNKKWLNKVQTYITRSSYFLIGVVLALPYCNMLDPQLMSQIYTLLGSQHNTLVILPPVVAADGVEVIKSMCSVFLLTSPREVSTTIKSFSNMTALSVLRFSFLNKSDKRAFCTHCPICSLGISLVSLLEELELSPAEVSDRLRKKRSLDNKRIKFINFNSVIRGSHEANTLKTYLASIEFDVGWWPGASQTYSTASTLAIVEGPKYIYVYVFEYLLPNSVKLDYSPPYPNLQTGKGKSKYCDSINQRHLYFKAFSGLLDDNPELLSSLETTKY